MRFRIDESHPNMLIIYSGTEHDVSDYETFLQHWVKWFDNDEKFGVIMVNEPHDHDDQDHERDEEEEERLVKIINDFRRDHRVQSNQKTVGFANVYSPEADWLKKMLAEDDGGWERLRSKAELRANYMFGTRGDYFMDLKSAKQWITESLELPPIEIETDITHPQANQQIGLYYGSTTGVTEKVAFDIQSLWESMQGDKLAPINIGRVNDLSTLLEFDYLILGVPTWNIGKLQDDWDIAFPKLAQLDFAGKQVALFGIGDQYGYPDNFLDALGILGNKLRERGATLIGFTSTDGYEFAESYGVENGQFMGLGIDEIHQSNLTETRIKQWVEQLIHEFNIHEPTR